MEQRLFEATSNQWDDILSRQAMMYLQTSCWSLAQSSHLMTPEQDNNNNNEENCNLAPGKAGYSSTICLSSPSAPALHKWQTRLAQGRHKWRPFLYWEMMRPHARPENQM